MDIALTPAGECGGRFARCSPVFDPHASDGVRVMAVLRRGIVLVRAAHGVLGSSPQDEASLLLDTAEEPRDARAEITCAVFGRPNTVLAAWSDGAVTEHSIEDPLNGTTLCRIDAPSSRIVALSVSAESALTVVAERALRGGRHPRGARPPGALDDRTRTVEATVFRGVAGSKGGCTLQVRYGPVRQKYRAACALRPDGLLALAQFVCTEDNASSDAQPDGLSKIVVFDQCGETVCEFQAHGVVTNIALHPTERTVFWSDFSGRLWSRDLGLASTIHLVSHWHAHTPHALAAAPARLLSAGEEGVLAAWDWRRPGTREMLPHVAGCAIRGLAASADGTHYAVATAANALFVVAAASLAPVAAVHVPAAPGIPATPAADGPWRVLAPSGLPGTALLLNPRPGTILAVDASRQSGTLLDVARQNTVGRGKNASAVPRAATVRHVATACSPQQTLLATYDRVVPARHTRGHRGRLTFFAADSACSDLAAMHEVSAVDEPHGSSQVVALVRGGPAGDPRFVSVGSDATLRMWAPIGARVRAVRQDGSASSSPQWMLERDVCIDGASAALAAETLADGSLVCVLVRLVDGKVAVVFVDAASLVRVGDVVHLGCALGLAHAANVSASASCAFVALGESVHAVVPAGRLWSVCVGGHPSAVLGLSADGSAQSRVVVAVSRPSTDVPAAIVALDAATGRPLFARRHHCPVTGAVALGPATVLVSDISGALTVLGNADFARAPPMATPSRVPALDASRVDPRDQPAAVSRPIKRRRADVSSALLADVPTALLPLPLAALDHVFRSLF